MDFALSNAGLGGPRQPPAGRGEKDRKPL